MRLSTVFRRARKLLDDGWVKGSVAADRHGAPLEREMDRRAVAFCALGALGRVTHKDPDPELYYDACRVLNEARKGWNDINEWNDHPATKKASVLKAFEKAEALAARMEGSTHGS